MRCKATENRTHGQRQCTGIGGHDGPHAFTDGETEQITLEQLHFELHAMRYEVFSVVELILTEIRTLRERLDPPVRESERGSTPPLPVVDGDNGG